MVWRNFGSSLAITRRRRVIATAVMYGLSLTVRLTSAAGDENEASAPAVQSTNPMMSIMINDGAQHFDKDWLPAPAHRITFHRGSLLRSSGFRAACESPVPAPFTSSCAAHP